MACYSGASTRCSAFLSTTRTSRHDELGRAQQLALAGDRQLEEGASRARCGAQDAVRPKRRRRDCSGPFGAVRGRRRSSLTSARCIVTVTRLALRARGGGLAPRGGLGAALGRDQPRSFATACATSPWSSRSDISVDCCRGTRRDRGRGRPREPVVRRAAKAMPRKRLRGHGRGYGRARLEDGMDWRKFLRHICRRAPGARQPVSSILHGQFTMTLAGAQVHGRQLRPGPRDLVLRRQR